MKHYIDEQIKIPEDQLFKTNGNHTNGNSNEEISPRYLDDLNERFENSSPEEILRWGHQQFGKDMVLGTGFGSSGVLLIHKLFKQQLPVTVFYLDTHLLFSETYTLRDKIEERFNMNIVRVSTNLSVDEQAEKHGDKLWKSDPDKCCYIRKVLPLKKYLKDKKAWVTGVRRSQGDTRKQTRIFEWDPVNEVIKINPLANWTNDEVWDYIHTYELPYNPLHDHGYPSIGCIPCTQPAETTEEERAGRWKNLEKTECGIHLPTQQYQNGEDSAES